MDPILSGMDVEDVPYGRRQLTSEITLGFVGRRAPYTLRASRGLAPLHHLNLHLYHHHTDPLASAAVPPPTGLHTTPRAAGKTLSS